MEAENYMQLPCWRRDGQLAAIRGVFLIQLHNNLLVLVHTGLGKNLRVKFIWNLSTFQNLGMPTVLWIIPVLSFLMSWGSLRLVDDWRWNSQPVQPCAKWKVYGTDLSIISTWVCVPRFPFWQLNATRPRLSPLGFKGIFKGFTEVWMCPLQRFCSCIKPKALGFEINRFLCENFFFYLW